MRGGERGAELVDLVAVAAAQLGELCGERADDVAVGARVVACRWRGLACCWARRCSILRRSSGLP